MNQIPDKANTAIIRMGMVNYIDQSGLYTMEDVLVELINQGIQVLLVDVQEQPRVLMEQIDIIPDLVSEDHIFNTFDEVMVWIIKNVEDTV